jgi:5,10-methylenetetrahydromethanopterin reductase
MPGLEVWTMGVGVPGLSVMQAERAEAAGFDGMQLVDSQNLAGDPYIGMALAAKATDRLRLATGVTNPVTRHPAVTAACIATVQAESNGRAQLGIGRGDSALAHLGRAPASVAAFEQYLADLQAYLRGDTVAFPDDGNLENLRLAGAPVESSLHWIGAVQPKVPVAVASTGPKVIAIAAKHADRVTLAVGADPERVKWGAELARAGGAESIGAYVNVVAHDDPATAAQLGEGGLATFARFSVMHGTPSGPVSDNQREVLTDVIGAYDMTRHTQAGSPQAGKLTTEFAERFGVFGPSDHCVTKLKELVAIGLDHVVIVGTSLGADREEASAANRRFVEEVLPALR